MNLVTAIGVLTSKSALRIELQVSELQSISNELRTQYQNPAMVDQVITFQNSTERALPRSSLAQGKTGRQLNNLSTAHTSNTSVKGLSHWEPSGPEKQTSTFEGSINQWRAPQVIAVHRRHRSPCDPGCMCHCHRRSNWTSSSKYRSFFGLLFISYTGLPVTDPCDDIRCQQIPEKSLSLRYYFPQWFTARISDICIQMSKSYGLSQSLRVSRVIRGESKLFVAVRKNDLQGLRAILSSREGTPYDVADDSGDTALCVSEIWSSRSYIKAHTSH